MADETSDPGQGQDDFDVPDTLSGPPGQSSEPGDAPIIQADGTAPATEPADPNAGYGDLPARLANSLREENLRPVPGETAEAAYDRLAHHISRKNAAYVKKEARDARRHADELAAVRGEMRTYLEPILREHYAREHQAKVELAAAQIPPKDSPEYPIWLQEELLRRDEERRQQEWQQAQDAQRQQTESAVESQVRAIDEAGYQKVARGLGLLPGTQADPEFTHAYEIYSESALQAARAYFPDASEQQIEEFIGLSQQLDIRRAEVSGIDIREVWKGRLDSMIDSLVRRGLVTRAQGRAAKAEMEAAAPSPKTPAPQAQAPAAPRQTVAQQVAAGAAAAARRGPSAVPGSSRPTQLSGQLPDTADFDEDTFVEAALAGILGTEEQRAAPHRKQR